MPNQKYNWHRILSNFIMAYLVLALAWWSVLLFRKNQEVLEAQTAAAFEKALRERQVTSFEAFTISPSYQELVNKSRKQDWMIMGESVFLITTMMFGIYFINRGYNREVLLAKQQRNFLLSITHELKSPLAGIKLSLETLKKRVLPSDKKLMLQDNALQDVERLGTLVDDILLSAKLDTAYQLHSETLDLSEISAAIVQKLQTKHPNAKLTAQLPPSALYEGDRQGITSVILNLVENAIKYSPSPAEVTLSLSTAPIQITVADQGFGIADNEKRNIFKKFYRIGDEDRRTTKGTGLGLYIVAEIVAAHDGKIQVKANHPRGTVMIVTLP